MTLQRYPGVEPFEMLIKTHNAPRSRLRALRSLTLAALSCALLPLIGCTISVNEGDWDGYGHEGEWDEGDELAMCYEDYECCLEEAEGNPVFVEACEDTRDACVDEHDGDNSGDGDGDGDSGGNDSGGDDSGGHDSGGNDSGGNDSGGNDSGGNDSGGEVDDICIDLHINCLANAETLLDVEACEGLYEHCANPGECQGDCPNSCPDEDLGACLDTYSVCVAEAATEAEVSACASDFEGCVDEIGGSECLPDYTPEDLDVCLEEHDLCTACAANDEQIVTCKTIFDACINPPM
ncbi:MAG TPA: hypothetical protein ENK31_02380 [Nannocystis exedens]|nr:hypothetical protein [Nannocystis exedens]